MRKHTHLTYLDIHPSIAGFRAFALSSLITHALSYAWIRLNELIKTEK